MIILVLACTQDGGIGYKNSLPWNIKSEMEIFKKITLKFPNVLMGRKTFDSLPFPLKKRKNIVLSNKENYSNDENVYFLKFDEKVSCKKITQIEYKKNNTFNFSNFVSFYQQKNKNICVIGGEEVFNLFFPFCDEIFISIIKKFYLCDKYFKFLNNVFNNKRFFELKEDRITCEEFINYHFIKKTKEKN
ncbi:dihydrofolate reductase [symbiont of Argiope bruennichi]|uniref:dihydrofolate reductase n=1 Tax=symbiont of Argiope bruennichi TaxID=2810479 RepID=UPI003DA4F369